MNKFDYYNNAYDILLENITNSQKELIDSKMSMSGNIWCSLVNCIEKYLNGNCESYGGDFKNFEDMFASKINQETGLLFSKNCYKAILEHLDKNRYNII